MGRTSSFLISLLMWGLAVGAAADARDASEIRQVRFGGDDGETRIVVELSSEMEFRAFTVSDPSMRLVVDLPRAAWSVSGLETGEGLGYGLVEDFRFFDRSANASRIVFELDGPSVITGQFGIPANADNPHHRLVVDLRRVESVQAEAAAGFPEASNLSQLIAERVEAVYVPPPRERRVIVLDAGHGGHDPGSLGAGGAEEADVTLAAARELQRQLEATGRYVVYMTRNDDTYPSWEERVGVMAEQRADLFLTIHADSSACAQTRGAAVYTLNDRAESRARRIARQGANHTNLVEVNNILVELELREKRNQSAAFAEVMLQHLAEAGPLLQNPHRQANLFVLLDPRVPAVLLEMGFMTNPSDLANMRSERSRSRQMAAVLDAIDAYFARDEVRGSNSIRAAQLTPIP